LTAFTVGIGFTVIVNVLGVPVQVIPLIVDTGVTVMVPEIAAEVVLVLTKLAMLPVPLAARPMAVLLLVQLYTVPDTVPPNVTAATLEPTQTAWLDTAFTVGVGLTVYVNEEAGPAQPTPPFVYVGVTVTVAVTGTAVVFAAANEAMLPTPLAARPIDGVLFVHA
jgi:hypothetical protein